MSKIQCGKCKEVITSNNKNDFNMCNCGETFIDGGDDVRFGWHTVYPIMVESPKGTHDTAHLERVVEESKNGPRESEY